MKHMRILSVGLGIVASLILAACQPTQSLQPTVEAPATVAPDATATPPHITTFDPSKYAKVFVYTIEEIENDGRSLLHISYPVTEQDAINARMEEISQQFIDEYRTTAAEIETSYQEYKKETGSEAATLVTHYRQNFDVSIANENVIFFDLERSIDTGGTGNRYVIGYIFDRRSGAELTIPDLFVDDSFLERLSVLTREALAERIRKEELPSDLDWVEGGTAPTAENFDNILFKEDGTVLVMFDKYQVAAGVAGVVEVVLPVAAIADLLKPEIRQLLGVQADEGTLSTELAKAVEKVRADVAFFPVRAQASSSALAQMNSSWYVQMTTLAGVETDSLVLAQTGAAARDEIDCFEVACVALTFDDGPSIYTEGLLDVLKEHDVQATFFILGQSARIQSETVSRMFEEGHQIGNHTWNHPNLTQLSDELIRQQIQQTDDILTQIIGEPTQHLRPPYGAYNDRVRAVSGLPIIFWSVDPLDWRDRDAEIVAARIIDSPVGAIILSHDIHRTTVAAVPTIIVALKSRGIHIVTVTKLFEPQPLVAGQVYIRQPDSPSD